MTPGVGLSPHPGSMKGAIRPMSATIPPPAPTLPETPINELQGRTTRTGDRVFRGLARGAGVLILLTMAAIALFLVWKAIPSLQANTAPFFTTQDWFPDRNPAFFGIAALLFGTVVTALIALLLAVPIGIGIALFTAFYATRRLAGALAFISDLLAAVPSIIFGMWGIQFLTPQLTGFNEWLTTTLGWIPI